MVIVINHCSSNLYGNRDMKVKLIFKNIKCSRYQAIFDKLGGW